MVRTYSSQHGCLRPCTRRECRSVPLRALKRREMLLCLSSADGWVLEEAPDATGDEAFDAADGFAFGLALGDAAGDVGLRGWVASPLGDGDEVERPVELAVSAAVEAMAGLVLAGGRRHRRRAAEAGERGFAVAATRV